MGFQPMPPVTLSSAVARHGQDGRGTRVMKQPLSIDEKRGSDFDTLSPLEAMRLAKIPGGLRIAIPERG